MNEVSDVNNVLTDGVAVKTGNREGPPDVGSKMIKIYSRIVGCPATTPVPD
jgi:hypothetical protein